MSNYGFWGSIYSGGELLAEGVPVEVKATVQKARVEVPLRDWKDFQITRSGTFEMDVSAEFSKALFDKFMPVSYRRDVPIPSGARLLSPEWVILPEWE